ncbi:hypothetical protein EGW08_005119 [Elysia chlorotica]|uniref:Uncharacterized protein n=1 Tax=Elysia chlorotica TaxID=188477 RepID=A0A3S1BRQ5_ELYCH|nr:hypothetical protein EGW08_005119 [Elysia chlorotica]
MELLLLRMQVFASVLSFILFAFDNILCAFDGSSDVVHNKSDSIKWLNQSLKEAQSKPRFRCDFIGQCLIVWVLEPACSDGYLQPPRPQPGYIKVSIIGSNLCSNESLSLSLGWLWASNKTNYSREIRRCSEMWTCRVPLKATLPSGTEQRWVDIVLIKDENSSTALMTQDLPIKISLRSKYYQKNKLRNLTYNIGQVGNTGRHNMSSPHGTFNESILTVINHSEQVRGNHSLTSFSARPNVSSHQKLNTSAINERTFLLERLIKLSSDSYSNMSTVRNNSVKSLNVLKDFKMYNIQNKTMQAQNNIRSPEIFIMKRNNHLRNVTTGNNSYTRTSSTVKSDVNMKLILQTILFLSHRKTKPANKSNFGTEQLHHSAPHLNAPHPKLKSDQIFIVTDEKHLNNQTLLSTKTTPSQIKILKAVNKQNASLLGGVYTRNQSHFTNNRIKDHKTTLHSVHTNHYLNSNWVQNENISQANVESIPAWLESSQKLPRTHMRARKSIRQVEEDEATDLAILMDGESKEDRGKIAAMIASDFKSTAGLSDPVVTQKHWQGGSSKIGRANDNNIKEMDNLISSLQDEEAKVSSNLPLGDGDQENLLVEVGSKAHLTKLRHQIRTKKRKLDHAKAALSKANLQAIASDAQGAPVAGEIIVEKNELQATVSDLESSLQKLKETYSDLINENRRPENEFKKLNGVVTIDPVWSLWSAWSSCGRDCTKGGYSTRRRSCDTLPSVPCPGSNFDMKSCNLIKCEGHWIAWGSWGPCSTSCGTGVRARSRVCQGSGECQGPFSHSVVCKQLPCSTYDDSANVLIPPESDAAHVRPVVVEKVKKKSPPKPKSKGRSTSSRRKSSSSRHGGRGRGRSRGRGRGKRDAKAHKLTHAGPLAVPKKFRDADSDVSSSASAAAAAALAAEEDEEDPLSEEEDEDVAGRLFSPHL